MDKQKKDRWTAALRSGEFKQGRGRLRDGYGHHCCLGVLCVLEEVPLSDTGYSSTGYQPIYDLVGSRDHVSKLWRMNDDGRSFSKIADWIEKNV